MSGSSENRVACDASSAPFVSVIVPVFNDGERLRRCLAVLERQTYPPDRYEVIVVDNGSDEDTAGLVAPFRHAIAGRELRRGSYAARNAGLALARGEVVAFTDADCIPAPDWIERGVDRLRRVPGRGLVAGRIDVFFKQPDRPTAVELYERVNAFPQQLFVEKYHFGATANVFTYTHIFEQVGHFDDTLESGGDQQWGNRVYAAGYGLAYAADVCVAHPARSSFDQLYAKLVRVTAGLQDLERDRSTAAFLREIARMLLPWRPFVRLCRDERLHGARQRGLAILVLLWLRYAQALIKVRLRFNAPGKRRGFATNSYSEGNR